MTLGLAVFVLIAAILLARGYALKSLPGPAAPSPRACLQAFSTAVLESAVRR